MGSGSKGVYSCSCSRGLILAFLPVGGCYPRFPLHLGQSWVSCFSEPQLVQLDNLLVWPVKQRLSRDVSTTDQSLLLVATACCLYWKSWSRHQSAVYSLLAFKIVLKYAHMWLTFSGILKAMTAIYVMKQLAHCRNVYWSLWPGCTRPSSGKSWNLSEEDSHSLSLSAVGSQKGINSLKLMYSQLVIFSTNL